MLPWSLVDDLVCPYCGSHFERLLGINESHEGLTDGILCCECYEYPVVRGIAVLRQMSSVSSTQNEAVERLKQGDLEGALSWLLEAGSAAGVPSLAKLRTQASGWSRFVQQVRQIFRESTPFPHGGPLSLRDGFEAALRSSRIRGYADYLFYRFANPSLIGAIPPLLVCGDACLRTSRRRVVDFLCGVGHTSAILAALCPGMEVVAADSDFVNLFLARNLTAPGVTALCVDAELPLPFADAAVDGLFCLDGLHYVRSKVALLREVDRIVRDEGFWLFAHMHNALSSNINPGAPLSPAGYAKRFLFGQQRLLSETEILRQFQTGGFLDLTEQPTLDAISSHHALTLIGARTDLLWTQHLGVDDALCRRQDLLEFNPLYRVEEATDELLLRAMWPSDTLRRECTGTTPLLPELVRLPLHIVEEILMARSGGVLSADVRRLVRSAVLVSLPQCYPRVDLPLYAVIDQQA